MAAFNSTFTLASTTALSASAIAFESDRDGNDEIYVMDADGLYQNRRTIGAEFDIDASWQSLPN